MSLSEEQISELKRELENIKRERDGLRTELEEKERRGQGSGMGGKEPVVVKVEKAADLSIQTLIPIWTGESGQPTIKEFLDKFDRVAEAGGWNEDNRRMILLLKLQGPAERCLQGLDPLPSYSELRGLLIKRFQPERKKVEILRELFQLRQAEQEGVKEFSDRLQWKGRLARQAGIGENEIPYLDLFIAGLTGRTGEILRCEPPTNWEKALEKATRIEKEVSKAVTPLSGVVGAVGTSSEGRTSGDSPRKLGGERGTNEECHCQRVEKLRKEDSQGRVSRCYECRKPGHLARNCPLSSRRTSFPRCFRCDQPGHMARNCPHPPVSKSTLGERVEEKPRIKEGQDKKTNRPEEGSPKGSGL